MQNQPSTVNSQVSDEKISTEKQKEILEKYDSESAVRNPAGVYGKIIKWIAVAMALFHLYTSVFGLMETIRHRAMHLAFIFPLAFLLYPAIKSKKTSKPTILDWTFSILGMISTLYLVIEYKEIFLRGGIPNTVDIVMGILCILLVLESVRRVVGIQLLMISAVFLVYAYFGPYMPGIFRHRGASISRMIDHIYMIPEGVFSVALGTSATFIVLFVIFAAFLERSGLADLIKDLAMALAGGAIGGPAKVAVVMSAAFGTISGSAAANVVTTGAFTIPLMKSTGYPKEFAAGVEAVASTGGQLMPPIMGSAAFIMADYLGVAYIEIVKAAIIPVFLYYLSLFLSIHIRAKKLGLKGVCRENLPKAWDVLKSRGHLLIPFVAVVILLVMRFTPIFAGSCGIVLTIAVAALRKETRMGFQDILWALENGAKRTVPVSIACASVGLVIGVCSLTGISSIIGNYILQLGRGNLLITLFLVMLLSIVMGMGLPTVAVYVLLSSIAVPVIVQLNVPALAAHFFIFYFGLMANVTPPVAIPAYAAAGLANSNPSKTGWVAFKLALAGFLIPYLFILNTDVLMINANFVDIIYSALTPILGILMLCVGIENYMLKPLPVWQRALCIIGSLALLYPGLATDLIGLAFLLLIFAVQKYQLSQVDRVAGRQ